MKNIIDINRNERLLDSMIEVAAEEAMVQRLATLPSREELDEMYPASPELQNRIDKIIAKEARRSKRSKLPNILMRTAASIGIFFVVGSIALMSVEASRNFILNAIVSIRHDHVAFEFTGEVTGDANVHMNVLSNFEYMGSQMLDQLVVSVYANSEGEQIVVSQHRGKSMGAAIDSDYREFTSVYINNQQVFLFESTDSQEHHVALWQGNEIVYHIHTHANFQEMLLFLDYLMT